MANAKKKKAERIVTPAGFFAYTHVHEPVSQEAQYDKGMFVATLVAKKDDPQWKEIRRLQLKVAQAKWGSGTTYKEIDNHINDGDEKADEEVAKLKKKASEEKDASEKKRILERTKHWEKWRGCYFIKAKQNPEYGKPGITGPNAKDGLPEGEDLQGGDFGRMTVIPFAYEITQTEIRNGKKVKTQKKGISFRLGNLQKQGTGERFKGSGGVAASEDFDDIEPLELEDGKDSADVEEDEEFEDEGTETSENEEEIFG